MPRVYFQYEDDIEPNVPLDICMPCWMLLDENELSDRIGEDVFDVIASLEDAGGNGHDHPSYGECDYTCLLCGRLLTEEDD